MVRWIVSRIHAPELYYIEAAGLSTDEKPTTGIVTGSKFFEVDTGYEYAFAEGDSPSWEVVSITSDEMKAEIDDWLDDHPEATTTVEDGAVGYAKLDSTLQGMADSVMAVSVSSNTLVMTPVMED